MLYDSDCSMHEADTEEVDSELLSNQPSTSHHGNHKKSREDIFTIQITPETGSFESASRSKRSSGYSSLTADDPDAGDDVEDGSPQGATPSRASSKSNISILKATGKQILRKARSKPDIQLHHLSKKCRLGRSANSVKPDDCIDVDDYINDTDDDDDDDVTLTSSIHRRRQMATSFDPGGSGFISMWSTYSELLYEHDGLSWACCVALVIAFCASSQCRAYTRALKMAAWFTVLILVLLSLKTYFYGTAFHDYRQTGGDATLRTGPRVPAGIDHRFMDMLHGNDSNDRYVH